MAPLSTHSLTSDILSAFFTQQADYTPAHKLFDWDLPHTEGKNETLASATPVKPSVASSMCKTGLS